MAHASETQLIQAMRNLRGSWVETAQQWRDEARASFEKDFLADLLHATKGACRGMSEIGELLHKVRRECS